MAPYPLPAAQPRSPTALMLPKDVHQAVIFIPSFSPPQGRAKATLGLMQCYVPCHFLTYSWRQPHSTGVPIPEP